jgi:ADP-heptose:LPS heptosyltransferase
VTRIGPIPLASLRRVLVIRRRALGDALVSLPSVMALRDSLPYAQIDLVVDRTLAPLFTTVDGIEILPWDGRDRLSTIRWIRELRRRRYDLVIDYLSTPQTALWTALSGARWRVGYDLRWRSWAYNVRVSRLGGARSRIRQFAGESFMDPLRVLGLAAKPWRPRGGLTVAVADLGEAYSTWVSKRLTGTRPVVGLVLSATWPAKAWPLSEAARLARNLIDDGFEPMLIPGPGEDKILEPLLTDVPDLVCAPATDLCELADLVSRLDVLVATDSGPRHLAAVMGVPTVTLYGPTDPAGWNQEHPLHVAVRTGESCSPCDLTHCPLPDHPCLTNLSATTVGEAVRAVLDRPVPDGSTNR